MKLRIVIIMIVKIIVSVINTSMNIKGESIVNTTEQANSMLTKTNMNYFLGNFLVKK